MMKDKIYIQFVIEKLKQYQIQFYQKHWVVLDIHLWHCLINKNRRRPVIIIIHHLETFLANYS